MIEGFYLETVEGLFFAVKGMEHPPDRWIAVLRYAPDPEKGNRRKDGLSYRRLYHFAEQEQLIRATYPQYLAYDAVFQTSLQSVPQSAVLRVYDPCLRLLELDQEASGNGIEEDAVAFARLIQQKAEVPGFSLGITGSILIGLHTELSDLDIVVFGTKNCKKVYETLQGLLDAPSGTELRRPDAQEIEDLYSSRAADACMTFEDFTRLEKRKVNQGSFRKRIYFIRFVKEKRESGEDYDDRRYSPRGRARITALIADDRESIFTPCRYLLSDAHNLDGSPLPDLKEIVSFRGRFCDQARAGESVMASGTLECVRNHHGDTWHRLLLGSSREDTMVAGR